MPKGFIILCICFIVVIVLLLDPWGWSKCHVNWSNLSGTSSPVSAGVNRTP